MEFVYVLGMASKNHRPMPFMKPFPSALTKSRTIRPSRRATPTLSTVRRTRKKEWEVRMSASLERHDGKAILRIANSWRKNVLSRLGLWEAGTRGKCLVFSANKDEEVETMLTCE